MQIGRRHFLKFIGSAIAGAQAGLLPEVFSSATHYIDRKLGFGFEIPNGWHLEAFRKDFDQLLGGQQLAEEFRDDDDLLGDLSEDLMATLSKYPIVGDSRARFSPSVTFFREDDSALSNYADLLELAKDAISAYSKVLTDYECTEDPKFIARPDCVLVRSKSKFLFEHEKMNSVLIDNETFLIHHGRLIYTLHLYDSPYTGDSSQDEFTLFRNSLHIA